LILQLKNGILPDFVHSDQQSNGSNRSAVAQRLHPNLAGSELCIESILIVQDL